MMAAICLSRGLSGVSRSAERTSWMLKVAMRRAMGEDWAAVAYEPTMDRMSSRQIRRVWWCVCFVVMGDSSLIV